MAQVAYPWFNPDPNYVPYTESVSLIEKHAPPRGLVVDLGAGAGMIGHKLVKLGFGYHGIESHPGGLQLMTEQGLSCSECDLTDLAKLKTILDKLDNIAAFSLLDVIEHLVNPQDLLTLLSEYALRQKSAFLVVSVPNVTHIDLGLKLLLGRWEVTPSGLLDSTHLRFFSNESLLALLHNCGWRLVERRDYLLPATDQNPARLLSQAPASVVNSIKVVAEVANPYCQVHQFIWILEPVPLEVKPKSYLDALNYERSTAPLSNLEVPTLEAQLGVFQEFTGELIRLNQHLGHQIGVNQQLLQRLEVSQQALAEKQVVEDKLAALEKKYEQLQKDYLSLEQWSRQLSQDYKHLELWSKDLETNLVKHGSNSKLTKLLKSLKTSLDKHKK
jgi:hypothetical protein